MIRTTAALLAILGMTARVGVAYQPSVGCCNPPPCCEPLPPVDCCQPACQPVREAEKPAKEPTTGSEEKPIGESANKPSLAEPSPAPATPAPTLEESKNLAPAAESTVKEDFTESSAEPASKAPAPVETPPSEPMTPADDATPAPPAESSTPPTAEQNPPAEEAPAEPATEDEEPKKTPDFNELFGPSAASGVLTAPGGWASDEVRQWSSAAGATLTMARIAGVNAEQVTLLTPQGDQVAVKLTKLGDDDLVFLRTQVEARQFQLVVEKAAVERLAAQGR